MRFSLIGACAGAFTLAVPLAAQSSATSSSTTAGTVLPPAKQIAAAVTAAPAEFREGATVLGYNEGKKLVTLRQGKGDMVCLADDPNAEQFHVACYHKDLEPFMARGRALRAGGVKGGEVDSVRFKEIKAGTLRMPATPSSLYTLTGPPTSFDPATEKVTGARWLYVVYIPGATGASTGLSEKAAPGVPWIMFPGTPKAHIMFFTGM
jgi:hypothetical protein